MRPIQVDKIEGYINELGDVMEVWTIHGIKQYCYFVLNVEWMSEPIGVN